VGLRAARTEGFGGHIVAVAVLLLTAGWATPGAVAQEELSGELSGELLGAGDFALRQQTTRQMWGAREQTREAVERAALDADPEVAARAQWILDRWREGILPETPLDVQRKLAGQAGSERLAGLLDAGLYEGVAVSIQQSVGTPSGLEIRTEVSEVLQNRFAYYLRQAIEEDRLDAFCRLLDVTTESGPLAVSRLRLLKRLGMDLDDLGILPASASQWPETRQRQTRIVGLVAIGEVAAALEEAREAELEVWERSCLVLLGRWQELAECSAAEARQQPAGTAAAYRRWSQCLVAAERAGLPAVRQAAVAGLREAATEDVSAEVQTLRWRSLLIHGAVDEAIVLLEETDPASAAEVLESLGRLEQAFAALEVDLDALQAGIERQLRRAAAAQRSSQGSSPAAARGATPELEKLLAIGRLLLRSGRFGQARDLYGKAAGLRDEDDSDRSARLQVVRALWFSSRREWALRFAATDEGNLIYPDVLDWLSYVLPKSDPQTFAIVWQALAKREPNTKSAQRLRWASQMFAGELPGPFAEPRAMEKLFDEIIGGKPTVRRVNGRLVVTGRDYMTNELGDFFLRLGHSEIAKQIYEQRSRKGDPNGDLQLARFQLAAGNAAAALHSYRQIWRQHAAGGGGVPRVNLPRGDMTASLKAAVGEAIALQRMGDRQAATEQFELVRLLLCLPSGFARSELAEFLAEWDKETLARETLLPLLRSSAIGQQEGVSFSQLAQTYSGLVAENAPGDAARWNDLVLSANLEKSSFFPRGYLILPARNHALLALQAARQSDAQGVQEHLDAALLLQPLAIDMAEELLPKLRKLGFESEADAALEQIFQAGQRYTGRFGRDASMANNLAWVVALSGRYLDQARTLSERACFLVPDSVSYRDTLAEIVFRQGESEQAIMIERQCLLEEPGEWHLHQQIERFESE